MSTELCLEPRIPSPDRRSLRPARTHAARCRPRTLGQRLLSRGLPEPGSARSAPQVPRAAERQLRPATELCTRGWGREGRRHSGSTGGLRSSPTARSRCLQRRPAPPTPRCLQRRRRANPGFCSAGRRGGSFRRGGGTAVGAPMSGSKFPPLADDPASGPRPAAARLFPFRLPRLLVRLRSIRLRWGIRHH